MSDPSPHARYLYTGLIRLHLLHHATQEPIYGLEMIEELARHGYRLSPGTLYPILHGLAERGLLVAAEQRVGRTRRRLYQATPAGRAALEEATARVVELLRELVQAADIQRAMDQRGCKRASAAGQSGRPTAIRRSQPKRTPN